MNLYQNKKIKHGLIYAIFIWHGSFLAITLSMIEFNTVLPSLLSKLIDSKVIFGLLYAILLGGPKVLNIFFSYYLQQHAYKRKFILGGIYLRSFSLFGMAYFTYYFATTNSTLVISSFFFWIFLFSVSGGFAGLAYSDIIGKLIIKGKRGNLLAIQQFASSSASLLGVLIVNRVFNPQNYVFPNNYSLCLLIGSLGLFVASLAFWVLREPSSYKIDSGKAPFSLLVKSVPAILKADKNFLYFIIVENLTSFSLMILPFYMVYAKETFNIDDNYISYFLLFIVIGTILSNIFWGFISDRYGSRNIVRSCILLGGLIPLLAIFLGNLGPIYFSVIFLLIGFIASGRKVGFESYILDIAPEAHRTVYLGIRGTLNVFVVLLPVLGGLFIEILGYHFTFSLVTGVMFIAFLLMDR